VRLGESLRGVATSAIDVSDGLAGDLGHILERSGVAATVQWEAIPRSAALRRLATAQQQQFVFGGGDDFELLFTAPPAAAVRVEAAAAAADISVTRIGVVRAGAGLEVVDERGRAVDIAPKAFDHFRP
jgi:thiamine-monophosphate kinase